MSKSFIGIDTSNYRTSVAAVDIEGNILFQKAVLLDVPAGKRGLRQSEAFFHHSNRLPEYLEELFLHADPSDVLAVGVSERPRRVEGSYMPCFLAGVNAAREIASALKVPCCRFSHQEGHAAAILESQGTAPPDGSIFFHLSGGTTEALLCRPDAKGYSMDIIGGTLDISIGQLLDRFGVALGLPFPSGSFLDESAYGVLSAKGFDRSNIKKSGILTKVKIKDGYFNLSGIETRLLKYAESSEADDQSVKAVTAELFSEIASLLIEESVYLKEKYRCGRIYLAGGVASSRSIRSLIAASNHDKYIHFGDPVLSGDNAVGTALLTKRAYETCNSNSGK